jgi:hypothetical protein
VHIESNLQIDGNAFEPKSCSSGQPRGFTGVELQNVHGQRLRLGSNLDGSPGVIYFAPGSSVGENMGPCGDLSIRQEHAQVGGVVLLEGEAKLSCLGRSHRVEGTVRFIHCR